MQYVFGYVRVTVSEIAEITRGRVISKQDLQQFAGEYPVYSSQTENNGELGRIDTFDFDGEYLTWTTDGANAGSVFYRNGRFSITNVCGLIAPDASIVDIRYLYFELIDVAKSYVNKGMGNPKLMSNVMNRIIIELPPIEIQHSIAQILNRFDTLIADMSTGLPAEIEARRKQYEYYRDMLLTFKEKQ